MARQCLLVATGAPSPSGSQSSPQSCFLSGLGGALSREASDSSALELPQLPAEGWAVTRPALDHSCQKCLSTPWARMGILKPGEKNSNQGLKQRL